MKRRNASARRKRSARWLAGAKTPCFLFGLVWLLILYRVCFARDLFFSSFIHKDPTGYIHRLLANGWLVSFPDLTVLLRFYVSCSHLPFFFSLSLRNITIFAIHNPINQPVFFLTHVSLRDPKLPTRNSRYPSSAHVPHTHQHHFSCIRTYLLF